ncbi:iron complex outermembrane receptor protein [Arcticibacter pallidicorallinus]|uniref:Iron complex outermembrane receptor protein n=1 Tax=Arcticibacter pallidicorallinus TaxID=1259464 RepID=A0A2T0U9A0_9SPHI|nr:TonB-dependent receptor [Arcticibacter pallidicorallinus]PRY54452.1 iron complex outermembrane receptor protein [Arcticibacter pallidicorallinus]
MEKIYLALFVLICGDLYAQSKRDTVISIDEVVINENRFSTPISKQNRNVYVIDQATIAKLPARSIQEILQYANGVDLRQRGPFGSQADISIDGGSFEQTVVLLNGTKVIDMQTAHNMFNLPIPVEAIERIEIIRGPAARIYGVNSLTGAINIITKKPTGSGILVDTYAGTNFEKDSEASGNSFYGRGIQVGGLLTKEKHQHSLFGSHDKSNGYRYNTGFENNKLLYLGDFQLGESNEITASFGYIDNGFGANGFYASPGDRNSFEVVQTTLASVQSKHQLSDKWTLMPRLSYRYNYDDYRYFGSSNLNTGRSQHYTSSIAAEVNSSYKTNRGEIGFGAEARSEDISSSNIGDHRRENFGVFAQYRTYLLEKLNVNVGTYLNYNSDYKWQIYPGVDASYEVSTAFKLVGNIGTSQRIPSFTDLFLNQRPGNIGNPDLDPERAFQGELGFKLTKGNLSVNSYYFHRKISNFIDWTRAVATDPWQSNNLGELVTKGFNIRSVYARGLSAKARLNFSLGYSFLDSDFKNGNPDLNSKYLLSSLKHQITNAVDIKYANFSLLFATRFNERISGPSYFINDLRVSQSINKLTVYLDAQNIFDTTYFEVGAIPLPSRWFSLGLKLSSF